ncbi:helix-turn-helix transcriptional regulator [Rhizobium laguerreae]|uniref:helix-turn-helix transcriptional regulator n=1 Tax=Rhizobium laguerreae TaxID=1076926 RepID=UPI001FEB1093|nr:helix-turn-helix domain-containing protein [Rhizobium laguerreae]
MIEPRLIGRKEAAAYCGIGESTFSLWVANHKMPPAIAGTRKWDKRAIDARLDEISGIGVSPKTQARQICRSGGAKGMRGAKLAADRVKFVIL